MKSLSFFRLKINPFFFITIFAFLFAESSVYSLAVLLCAAIHEAGHLFAVAIVGAKLQYIELLPFGAKICYSGKTSYKSEFFIAASGPLAGLLLAIGFYCATIVYPCPFFLFSTISSLFLSAINLLPIKGFDGARCLSCILFCVFEYEKALQIKRIAELLCVIFLCAICTFLVILSCYNLSLCAICAYLVFFIYTKYD